MNELELISSDHPISLQKSEVMFLLFTQNALKMQFFVSSMILGRHSPN